MTRYHRLAQASFASATQWAGNKHGAIHLHVTIYLYLPIHQEYPYVPNKKTLNMRYLRFVTTSVLLLVLIVFFVVFKS